MLRLLSTILVALAMHALAPGALAAPSASSCSCGFTLTAHNNAYFRHLLDANFATTSLSGTATSADWLSPLGFQIADGFQVGGKSSAPDGTVPMGSFENIRIEGGVLELVVPGGQKITNGGTTTNAEISGPSGIINGVFTMNALIDKTVGTDQSIFTFHDDDTGTQDEQDIEILGAYLFEAGSNGTPPGIELTNWDPTDPNNSIRDDRIDPFPVDPTVAFHNYTIAWLPGQTTYFMDSTALDSPTEFFSVNPSTILLNHWTNGDPAFTQGPPATDAILKVKEITAYYTLSGESGLPSGCTQAQVCVV